MKDFAGIWKWCPDIRLSSLISGALVLQRPFISFAVIFDHLEIRLSPQGLPIHCDNDWLRLGGKHLHCVIKRDAGAKATESP